MPRTALTGSRIRERRQALQMKQADLARAAGISASYLNLIEHNRRRIGGKVLLGIARALEVDPTLLTEGAEQALLDALRDASGAARNSGAELDRIEEFVARFPGWARLVAGQRQRLARQERLVEGLNDRLTHDPFLSEAMHDLLSNVTAIRSTASILAQTPELEQVWRDRFHRNLLEESDRLAEGSRALAGYFDRQVQSEKVLATPQEALETVLGRHGHHLPEVEAGDPRAAEAIVEQVVDLAGPPARALTLRFLDRLGAIARALPAQAAQAAFTERPDPAALAAHFGVPLQDAMLRLAFLPREAVAQEIGLIVSDASGSLVFRKAISGFSIPRFGAACPVWPMFEAFARPFMPFRAVLETPLGRQFDAHVCGFAVNTPGFGDAPILQAAMLISPALHSTPPDPHLLRRIGTTCRLCPRSDCAARREPSILES